MKLDSSGTIPGEERLAVPERVIASPEHRLDERLAETDPDSARSRCNALVRRLTSFENAAERAQAAR